MPLNIVYEVPFSPISSCSLFYKMVTLFYKMVCLFHIILTLFRVRTAQGKPGKRDFLGKNQGKPGKLREFSDRFYNFRENSGNFTLPNISDQIG